jgi:hypothetical protein
MGWTRRCGRGRSDRSGPKAVASGPAPSAPGRFCRLYTPVTDYLLDETRNWNWTNGVKIGQRIGIDLSARSGYSEHTAIVTNLSRRVWVCGVKDVPFGEPGQVVYRRRR